MEQEDQEISNQLKELQEQWEQSQRPRAVSLTISNNNIMYKLYTDGSVYRLGHEEGLKTWEKLPEDDKFSDKVVD